MKICWYINFFCEITLCLSLNIETHDIDKDEYSSKLNDNYESEKVILDEEETSQEDVAEMFEVPCESTIWEIKCTVEVLLQNYNLDIDFLHLFHESNFCLGWSWEGLSYNAYAKTCGIWS